MPKMLHIALGPEDAAKYALIPGNPDRCEKIAAMLDDRVQVAQNREHTTYADDIDEQWVLVNHPDFDGDSSSWRNTWS